MKVFNFRSIALILCVCAVMGSRLPTTSAAVVNPGEINAQGGATVNGIVIRGLSSLFTGSRIIVGNKPAFINIGLAGRISLDPQTECTVLFNENDIKIELHRGAARIQKDSNMTAHIIATNPGKASVQEGRVLVLGDNKPNDEITSGETNTYQGQSTLKFEAGLGKTDYRVETAFCATTPALAKGYPSFYKYAFIGTAAVAGIAIAHAVDDGGPSVSPSRP